MRASLRISCRSFSEPLRRRPHSPLLRMRVTVSREQSVRSRTYTVHAHHQENASCMSAQVVNLGEMEVYKSYLVRS